MKQKINPFAAGLVILVMLGVVGFLMYAGSEPPMAHVRARTPEETAREAKASAAGFKSMFDTQAKKMAAEKGKKPAPGKESGTNRGTDSKSETQPADRP